MRIIKRLEREKLGTKIAARRDRTQSVEAATAIAATVHSWIDELREKREHERRSIQQLFKLGNLS
jgi:hypothetical protein